MRPCEALWPPLKWTLRWGGLHLDSAHHSGLRDWLGFVVPVFTLSSKVRKVANFLAWDLQLFWLMKTLQLPTSEKLNSTLFRQGSFRKEAIARVSPNDGQLFAEIKDQNWEEHFSFARRKWFQRQVNQAALSPIWLDEADRWRFCWERFLVDGFILQ